MLTITCVLAIAGLISAIVSLAGKCPVIVPVLLISLAQVLSCLPLR